MLTALTSKLTAALVGGGLALFTATMGPGVITTVHADESLGCGLVNTVPVSVSIVRDGHGGIVANATVDTVTLPAIDIGNVPAWVNLSADETRFIGFCGEDIGSTPCEVSVGGVCELTLPVSPGNPLGNVVEFGICPGTYSVGTFTIGCLVFVQPI